MKSMKYYNVYSTRSDLKLEYLSDWYLYLYCQVTQETRNISRQKNGIPSQNAPIGFEVWTVEIWRTAQSVYLIKVLLLRP